MIPRTMRHTIVFVALIHLTIAENSKYSISPDKQLSVLNNAKELEVIISCLVNDSLIWCLLNDHCSEKIQPERYIYIEYTELDKSLESVDAAVPISGSRVVFVGNYDGGKQRITMNEIECQRDENNGWTELDSQNVTYETEEFVVIFDPKLNWKIYIFSSTDVVIYNLHTMTIDYISWKKRSVWKSFGPLLNIVVIDEKHLLIGSEEYYEDDDETEDGRFTSPVIAIIRIDFNSPSLKGVLVDHKLIHLPDVPDENDSIQTMKMSLNVHGDIVLGIPDVNRVFIAHIDFNEMSLALDPRELLLTQKGYEFGDSVLWLGDSRQFAVVSYDFRLEGERLSLIFTFNLNDESLYVESIFPSNQQRITTADFEQFFFIELIDMNKKYVGILTDDYELLMLPLSTPGGTEANRFGDCLFQIGSYQLGKVSSCLPGMYKNNNTLFGPCHLCPAGTKASNYGSAECTNCSKTSNCPSGTISDEVDYSRVVQTVNYPATSDSDSFDDIILTNMFRFQCLSISPVFWMFITISIAICCLVIIGILIFFPKTLRFRTRIIRAFERVDLIGEGRLWIGGVASCGIFVLVIFAALFSMEYLNLYPIEDVKNSAFSCHSQLANSKFRSGLQLIALPKSDEDLRIFQLLDEQPLILSLDLINTITNCSNTVISVEEYNLQNSTLSAPFNCSMNKDNVTLTVSTSLSSPVVRIRIQFYPMYPVGSIRICLHGVNNTGKNGQYQIRQLLVCEIFSDLNHSISSQPEFDIRLTKVINRTEALDSDQMTTYSGLWLPLIKGKDVTTKLIYKSKKDQYKQYFVRSMSIVVRLTESEFFVENKQEPVARKSEVIFHNVLFLGVTMELFGLTFLLSKLIFIPIIRLVYNCFFKYYLFNFKIRKKKTMRKNVPTPQQNEIAPV